MNQKAGLQENLEEASGKFRKPGFSQGEILLGFSVVPFYQLVLGEGSATKIDYRKNRVPTYANLSILEDLA